MPQSDSHDGPRLVDKSVPGVTAVVEDILVGREDTVREPVVPHELPDVQLGAFGRQRDDGDVVRDDKPMRQVPSRLVDEKHSMSPWCDETVPNMGAEPDVMPVEERQHPVVQQVGSGDRCLSVVEFGECHLGIGVDEGLLVV